MDNRKYLGKRYALNVPGSCSVTARYRVKGYTSGGNKLVIISDAGREDVIPQTLLRQWLKEGHLVEIAAGSDSNPT